MPHTDFVWGKGYSDWVPRLETDGFPRGSFPEPLTQKHKSQGSGATLRDVVP